MPLLNENENYCNITPSTLSCFGFKFRFPFLVSYFSTFLNSEERIMNC
jgi:uncharacterized membrane protein (DUF485 family)